MRQACQGGDHASHRVSRHRRPHGANPSALVRARARPRPAPRRPRRHPRRNPPTPFACSGSRNSAPQTAAHPHPTRAIGVSPLPRSAPSADQTSTPSRCTFRFTAKLQAAQSPSRSVNPHAGPVRTWAPEADRNGKRAEAVQPAKPAQRQPAQRQPAKPAQQQPAQPAREARAARPRSVAGRSSCFVSFSLPRTCWSYFAEAKKIPEISDITS